MSPYDLEVRLQKALTQRKNLEDREASLILWVPTLFDMLATIIQHEADVEAERCLARHHAKSSHD
jgi:hypothetical protein